MENTFSLTDQGNGFFVPTIIRTTAEGVEVWQFDEAYYTIHYATSKLETIRHQFDRVGRFYGWHQILPEVDCP